MWTPKLSIKDKPSKENPDIGLYQIVYWCRDLRKYKYAGVRYGKRQSKRKALEVIIEKQKELKNKLTYDGRERLNIS